MSEWKKTYLRDLIVIKNGKDHKKLKNGQYPVYGSGGIMRYADSYLYDQESVLLPRKGTLNNIQFVTEPFWTVDTCYYTVVNRDKVLPYFLYCCLCKMDIQSLNTGSAVPSMTFEKYYSIEVPIPPLSTQHRIANILSRYDSLIENYQKQIKLLKEAAQRLYKEWFVDLRFPGHENTKIIDGVPEGWKKKKAIDFFEMSIGKTPPRAEKQWFTDGKEGVPWVSISDMKDVTYLLQTSEGLTKEACEKHNVRIVDEGTVLLSFKLTVGRVSIAGMNVCTNEAIAHFNKNGDDWREYTLLYLRNYNFDTLGNTSGISKAVNSTIVKNMPFLMPSGKVLDAFSNVAKPLFQKIKNLSSQLRLLTEARDRLLPKLMSGEIEI